MLEEFVQAQTENPMFERKRDGHSIYQSHNQFGPARLQLGPIVPVIADFGHAQWINDSLPQIHPIQTDYYRAPEVILGVGWGSSADIWNLGVLVCTNCYTLTFPTKLAYQTLLTALEYARRNGHESFYQHPF